MTSLGKRVFLEQGPAQPGGVPSPVTIVEVVICEESFVANLGEDGEKDLDTFPGERMGPN